MAGKLSTQQWISREEGGIGGKSRAEEAKAELGGCGWYFLLGAAQSPEG